MTACSYNDFCFVKRKYFIISFLFIGKITSPRDGTELTILPGSTRNITWTFDDDLSTVTTRSWFFTSSVDLTAKLIAQISVFGHNVRKDILPGVDIIEPATLNLTNVSQSYDGTYVFSLKIGTKPEVTSKVIAYIASKFNLSKHVMFLNILQCLYRL